MRVKSGGAGRWGMAVVATLLILALARAAAAQDLTITDEMKARLKDWAENNPRQGGTNMLDWRYELPEGVTVKQVAFHSDDVRCYAKMFYPKGFTPEGKWPAVVLGHGFNAISVAIEKYGAYFAQRGLVAMVMDYRGYGFSDGLVSLLEPDTTTDDQRITEKTARVMIKRTRLIAAMQAEDYRNAISFLQGEPGVDPERIGIWGSSHAGGVVITVAGLDARVKAVVAQVSSVGGRYQTGPVRLEGELLEDAIKRARTGQGAETDAGFSFRGLIDLETRQTGREHRPWRMMERIPETTAILWLPAEKEELGNPRGPSGPFEAAKAFKGKGQVVEIPYISHFQVYGGAAFDVSSKLAAEWFLTHL